MQSPEWFFQPVSPNDRVRESQVEKFFKSDVLENRPTAVVREGIQNSLDALVDEYKDVLVRIGLRRAPAKSVRPFLPKLFAHLNADAVRAKLPQLPSTDEEVCYLTFEDFHTTGLEGDPAQWEPLDEVKNPFFNFFRGEGVTDKSGNARGRHGVGKLVFSALASRAHCMFGLTVTDDGPLLVMGTSTLVQHRVDRSYHPDGWFGVERHLESHGKLQVPVEDEEFIQKFSEVFGLQRGQSPGLSIVVPWIDPQVFSHEAVLHAVLSGFFWPILRKELIVDLESEKGSVSIDAKSFRTAMKGLDDKARHELEPTVALAEWAQSAGAAPTVTALPPGDKTPHWTADSLSPDALEGVRQACEGEHPVSIEVPMGITPKKGEYQAGKFQIYLQPDLACGDGRILYLREGLIISGVRPKRCHGVRALVVVDDKPLNKFLGDAENPAHTEWLKENVKSDYKSWVACLEYVIQSVPSLLRLVSEQQKEADPTLLLDLFALPTLQDAPKKPQPGPKKKGAGDSGGGIPVLPPRPKRFSLACRASGFVVRKGDPEAELPTRIDIQLGYGVRRGSPFRKWRPADFDLEQGHLDIEAEGCRYETPAGNRLLVTIDSPEFSLAVTGFDTNRDLHIDPRVKTREETDGETT